MKTFLLGVEQNAKGDKISITYAQENSQSKSTFNADIFPQKFMEFLYTMTEEFKRMCRFGMQTNYALSGFKVRDIDDGARQEIQFILNIRQGNTSFENAKTVWREMRDIPLEIFKGEDSEGRKEAEAMNGIVALFNSLQEYVSDHLAKWLEMDSDGAQMSLFDRKKIEDTNSRIEESFDRLDKLQAAQEFSRKMKAMSDETGHTMTISSGGKDIAVFAPDEE